MKKTGILKQLGISAKVVTVGLTITALFAITIFAWVIPAAERAILDRKREKIKEATETAWSVLEYYQSLVSANELSLQEAQQRALTLIKHMRYGPEMKDYFWINDMRPFMVMHPYRSDLDGKTLADFKDPNGIALFVEFARTCRKEGAGFVGYSWQWKDDESNIVPKISYVRLYRPWQWIVGTGMYIEDVRAEIRGWRVRVMLVSAIVAVLGIFLSWRIGREVAERMRLLSRKDGDLLTDTHRVWRLQSMVMLIIVPALVLLTCFWCVRFYRSLNRTIIDGFDAKLGAIGSATGAFINGEEHETIMEGGSEDHPLYRKYVQPMQKIRERTGLTYLYTQVLTDTRSFCNYILDSSEGDDHSAIGYRDELPPADYQGAKNVLLYGITHIGGVEPTEGWGLIKVCYAPIYNRDDTIHSMAGADVNISAISAKTRTALFAVGLLALCAVGGISYITVLFSKRFQTPITELRDAALMIAGGNHDHRVNITEPGELTRLSSAFNRIGTRLKETISELRAADRKIIRSAMHHDLILALNAPWAQTPDNACSTSGWLNGDTDTKTASGWTAGPHARFDWLGLPLPPLDALMRRCETAAALTGPAQTGAGTNTDDVEEICRDRIRACFVTDRAGIRAIVYEPVDIVVLTGHSEPAIRTLNRNTELTDMDCRWIVVSDRPDLVRATVYNGCHELMQDETASTGDVFNAIKANYPLDATGQQSFLSVLEVRP